MTAATNPVDAGLAYRAALFDAAKAVHAGAEHVLVTRTFLKSAGQDMIVIGNVEGGLADDAPRSGSQRIQDWDLACDVHAYAFRAGGADAEQSADAEAFEAASNYLSAIAEYVRRTGPEGDTTLGGTVMWCRMESFTTVPGRDQAATGVGRMWEFIGTFIARARVTG